MKKSLPLKQPSDRFEMTKAIEWCQSKNIPIRRQTTFQLKIGPINFFPNKGTVHVDEIGTLTERGLEVFQALLERPHRTVKEVRTACRELNLIPDDAPNVINLFP